MAIDNENMEMLELLLENKVDLTINNNNNNNGTIERKLHCFKKLTSFKSLPPPLTVGKQEYNIN